VDQVSDIVDGILFLESSPFITNESHVAHAVRLHYRDAATITC
jgi:hypothetical protein